MVYHVGVLALERATVVSTFQTVYSSRLRKKGPINIHIRGPTQLLRCVRNATTLLFTEQLLILEMGFGCGKMGAFTNYLLWALYHERPNSLDLVTPG